MQNGLKVERVTLTVPLRRSLEGILGYGKAEWDAGTEARDMRNNCQV